MKYDPDEEYPELPLDEIYGILNDASLWNGLTANAAEMLPETRIISGKIIGHKGASVRMVFTAMRLWFETELDNKVPPLEILGQPPETIAKEIHDWLPSAKIALENEKG